MLACSRAFHDNETCLLLAAPIYFKEDDGHLKKLHKEFSFSVTKLAIWARNYSCLDCWWYAGKTGQAGHKGKRLLNFAKIKWDSPFKSLLHRKSARCSRYRLKMDAQMLQRNPGWLPRQPDICFFGSDLHCIFCLLSNSISFWGL